MVISCAYGLDHARRSASEAKAAIIGNHSHFAQGPEANVENLHLSGHGFMSYRAAVAHFVLAQLMDKAFFRKTSLISA